MPRMNKQPAMLLAMLMIGVFVAQMISSRSLSRASAILLLSLALMIGAARSKGRRSPRTALVALSLALACAAFLVGV